MTNTIRQHIPTFVSGVDPTEARFETKEDLFAIPFVERFQHLDGFHQFSISRHSDRDFLMAGYGNERWHVVGWLTEGQYPADIPVRTPARSSVVQPAEVDEPISAHSLCEQLSHIGYQVDESKFTLWTDEMRQRAFDWAVSVESALIDGDKITIEKRPVELTKVLRQ